MGQLRCRLKTVDQQHSLSELISGQPLTDVAADDGVAGAGGVDGVLARLPDVVLDEELGTNARVDTVLVALVEVVPEMTGTEAERRRARVDVLEVVADVRDTDGSVLCAVAIGVANKRALVVLQALAHQK